MPAMPPADPPQRITADNGPWPLFDAAASRRVEATALAAAAPGALMAQAGLAVARLALAVAPHATRVQVWAGPGNNGGDGLVAAKHLHLAGRTVQVNLIADAARLPADAAQALEAARAAGVPLSNGAQPWAEPGLVIDALLGIGAHRPPAGALAQAIRAVNVGSAPVLAVDIPSGLHPDSGAVLGAEAVRARHTLSLLTLKPGCFTHEGRDHSGQLWLDSLGVQAEGFTATLSGPALPRARLHAAHKGRFGDVAVAGGAPGMEGAAWLAGGAALAAGAGRVYVCLLDGDGAAPPAGRPELMTRSMPWLLAPAVLKACTVVCGCGGGESVQAALAPLLSLAARLVLDADALNVLASDTALQRLLTMRALRSLPTLLTPHPLEAARLLGCAVVKVQQDRLAAARALAARHACTVLLKGSGTVIASAGALAINSSGNAALSTAGTGDVLAGWCGGLWAQQPTAAASDIAAAGAWEHGRAADDFAARSPGRPLRAAELIEALAHRSRAPAGAEAPAAR